jgi:hypothetical protein
MRISVRGGRNRCTNVVGKIFAFCFLFSTLPTNAQQNNALKTEDLYSSQTLKEMRLLQQAALSSDYAYKQAAYLCNNIGPRLTGSPQAERAVEYVADEMKKLGLEVRLQKLTVPHWVRGEEKGELIQFPGMAQGSKQKIVLTALGGSVATPPEGLSAEVIVVNNFDELNTLDREKVVGKIVLFNYKFDRQLAEAGQQGAAYGQAVAYRGGANAASRFGAVAALNRSAGSSQNRLAHTGGMRYADDVKKIPAAAVSYEDADLIAHLASQGVVKMRLILTPQTLPDTTSYNVIADLKGSQFPEQVVIVSGHLDSWDLGTGAIDDAAGVAVAMEVVNVVKKLNLKPKRTIRFIAWMNEENGLVGGRTYAAEVKEKNKIANHFAALESDGGAGHPLGFNFKGKREAMAFFTPITQVLLSQGAGLSHQTDGIEADISPLSELGVPAFGLWQDGRTYFNYHHTEADTLDKIVPRELAENAAVMTVLAYALANLQQPLPR